MKDQVPKAQRITVAEAFRRLAEVIEHHEDAQRFPDYLYVYRTNATQADATEGDSAVEPRKYRHEHKSGKDIAVEKLRVAFASFCRREGVHPRNLHDPWGEDEYSGAVHDFTFDIDYAEYERWAAPYLQTTIPRQDEPGGANDSAAGGVQAQPEMSVDAPVSWKVRARMIGDVMDARDKANNAHDGLRNLSLRIEKEMRLKGFQGPRGPVSAATILREALSGAQWKRKT